MSRLVKPVLFPAPFETDDVDVMLTIARVLYPGCICRSPYDARVQISVEATADPEESAALARGRFHTVVGAMRVLNAVSGPRGKHSSGQPASDEEVVAFARQVAAAMPRSAQLRRALWLNGAAQPAASAHELIVKCAEAEFGGAAETRIALQLPAEEPAGRTGSAKGRPLLGRVRGRTATTSSVGDPESERFSADLLGRWIAHHSATDRSNSR